MKKETKNNLKSDVITGASSAVGATIGMMAGSALANEVNAADVVPQPVKPTPVNPVKPTPAPVPPPEPEIEVLGYETITNYDGSPMDVALISIDDQQMVLADVDMDGTADFLMADSNCNGILDEEEIMDISGEGIGMAAFRSTGVPTPGGNIYLADNGDYVNDADVDDFMA